MALNYWVYTVQCGLHICSTVVFNEDEKNCPNVLSFRSVKVSEVLAHRVLIIGTTKNQTIKPGTILACCTVQLIEDSWNLHFQNLRVTSRSAWTGCTTGTSSWARRPWSAPPRWRSSAPRGPVSTTAAHREQIHCFVCSCSNEKCAG